MSLSVNELIANGSASPKRNNRQTDSVIPSKPVEPPSESTRQENTSEPERANEKPASSEQKPTASSAVVKTSRKKRKEVQSKQSAAKVSESGDDFNYRGSMSLPEEYRVALKIRSMRERCPINDIVIAALERELSSGKYDDLKAARTFMQQWSGSEE